MRRKQIYIAQAQEEELVRLAEGRRVPVSHLIREAIAEYLVEQRAPELSVAEEHPLWGLVAVADDLGAPADGSVNHDAVLYGKSRRRRRS